MYQSVSAYPPLNETDGLSPSVSFNEVIQSALQKFAHLVQNGSVIVRCEQLPHVYINGSELQQLTTNLLSVVLTKEAEGRKQFLHINCRYVPNDGNFEVQFKTNFKTELKPNSTEKHLLDECEKILQRHGGMLRITCEAGEGCLFSILVPGKIL